MWGDDGRVSQSTGLSTVARYEQQKGINDRAVANGFRDCFD